MIRHATILFVLLHAFHAAAEPKYVPPAADQVTNYFATVLPCEVKRKLDDGLSWLAVECKDKFLEKRTLRELAILRNTIYSRYGWDGYRKPWLRTYFHAQPWFKPNPNFTYHLISEVDRQNAHLIASREQTLIAHELNRMQDDVYARHGKIWNDVPVWKLKIGKELRSCHNPEDPSRGDDDWRDCRYRSVSWYTPNPAYTDALLTSDDKIELGLLSRALGLPQGDYDESEETDQAKALDRLFTVEELRQLSIRDLRILRNTIYARHGRPFKSAILQSHFNGMKWYKRRSDYSDKLLTKNDNRNIALIKSVENEFGGSLTDEDWLIGPQGIDGA